MFRNRRQTATGLFLLAIILLTVGCAAPQTATPKKRSVTAAPRVQPSPDWDQQQKAPAQKVMHAEPLNSSLISSKFKEEKAAPRQEITVSLADIEFVVPSRVRMMRIVPSSLSESWQATAFYLKGCSIIIPFL